MDTTRNATTVRHATALALRVAVMRVVKQRKRTEISSKHLLKLKHAS